MLELWCSTDRTANTDALLARICRPPFDKKRYLIVPEQFSHILEQKLCRIGGDSISAHAEVLGFSRLADRVFASQGGVAATQTDAAGKLLLMSLAAERVSSELKVFSAVAQKPDFLLLMLRMIDEFESFCISPQALRRAARQLDGVLALKAEEFALLTESFRAVCAEAGQSPKTQLTRLLEALEGGDFSGQNTYFFDGFTDFNGVQREIIAQLLASGAQVSVTLCCGALDGHEQRFATACHTAQSLISTATRLEVSVQHRQIEPKQNPVLSELRARLFTGATGKSILGEEFSVCCALAQDIVLECEAAAGEILRLVRGGARWREIGVACADTAAYTPILRSVFARAQICAYFAGTEDLLHCAPIYGLLCALRAASGGMEQEDVLDYLKSGFAPVSDAQADRLEDYILLWNLNGAQLARPWSANPKGLRVQTNAQTQSELRELNELREIALAPLDILKKKLSAATSVGQMTLDFYDFIEKIGWNDRVAQQAQTLHAQGALRQAQIYCQLPTMLCELLEQLYGTLYSAVRTAEEFFALLRAALGQYTAGTIPATADCVTVGSLSSMRRAEVSYLLLLGANEGAFPAAVQNASLLTDSERGRMLGCGIELLPDARGRLERELAGIDSVLSAPQKGLYCSALTGSESYYFRRLAQLLNQTPCDASSELLTRLSPRFYLSQMTAQQRESSLSSINQQAQALYTRAAYHCGSLSEQTARQLYGRTLRLSSTRIDLLASCELAHFFQYGLRAKKREKAELDASLYGDFVHYVLEQTVRNIIDAGGVAHVDVSSVDRFAEEAMARYAEERISELLRDEREAYLFTRSFSEVRQVVRAMYEELLSGSFSPECVELHFGKHEQMPAVEIHAAHVTAFLEGFVDRVDVWRSEGQTYVRVVDYKTGKKHFDYASVLGGVGLQMLLYLFSLARNGEFLFGTRPLPAGVEYFPARTEKIRLDDRSDLAALEKKREKLQRRQGLFLNDLRVLRAMEHSQSPRYLPYEVDKDGQIWGDLADVRQLQQLERYIFSTVAEYADRLYEGRLDRPPCKFAEHSACTYCDYVDFCGKNVQTRVLGRISRAEFWKAIGENTDE